METPLSIGQVAKKAQIGIETIRYYERMGLIEKPARKASGYRQYHPQVISRLQFIRRAKELGFTLDEITDLLKLRHDARSSAKDVKNRVENKILKVEEKIKQLQRIKRGLKELAQSCSGKGSLDQCPIINSLEGK